ncbi:MAG: glutathione peroxidase [Planctomycetota bacterium]
MRIHAASVLFTLFAVSCGSPEAKPSGQESTGQESAAKLKTAADQTAKAGQASQPPADVVAANVAKDGVYGLTAAGLGGSEASLADYKGKVTLFVNVASECGYTPQYAGMQKLHEEFADQGFAVLGFPCNQFGGQEPGTAEQIKAFCDSKYGVTFPMFAKCDVKGADQSPVYQALSKTTGEEPKWNFCKYLVGKDGKALAFYPSSVKPDAAALKAAIRAAL